MPTRFQYGTDHWLLCRDRDILRPQSHAALADALRPAWERGELAGIVADGTEAAFEQFVADIVAGTRVLVRSSTQPRPLDPPRETPLIDDPVVDGPTLAWIEFEVVGERGDRYPGHAFTLELADGSRIDGSLDARSCWHSESLRSQGGCALSFDPFPPPSSNHDAIIEPTPGDRDVSANSPSARISTGRRTRLVVGVPAAEFIVAVAGPNGERVLLPIPKTPVVAELADGSQRPLEALTQGRFKLGVPEDLGLVTLRYPCASECLVVPASPDDAPYFATSDEAQTAFAAGANFFTVPSELVSSVDRCTVQGASLEQDWIAGLTPASVPAAAIEVTFTPQWHCLQFDYYDRSSGTRRSVGALRSPVALVVDEHDPSVEQEYGRQLRDAQPRATTGWPVTRGTETVHCLARFERFQRSDGVDPEFLAAFRLPADVFIDHRGATPSAGAFPDTADTAFAHEPCVARWFLYDLPQLWCSRGFPVARGHWSAEAATIETTLPRDSSISTPLVFCLDTIRLAWARRINLVDRDNYKSLNYEGAPVTVFGAECNTPHKPSTSGVLCSAVWAHNGVVYDLPPDARLILVGSNAFEAFADRDHGQIFNGRGVCLGARVATLIQPDRAKDKRNRAFGWLQTEVAAPAATAITNSDAIFLRCAGVSDGQEQVSALMWTRLKFNYDPVNVEPKTPPRYAEQVTPLADIPEASERQAWERACLTDARRRWTANDTFSIDYGDPVSLRIRPQFFFQSDDTFDPKSPHLSPHYVVRVYETARSHMGRPNGQWTLSEIKGPSGTPAHEIGHALGLPDEYIEPQHGASMGRPGFSDNEGSIYAIDRYNMMAGSYYPRPRHLWFVGQLFRGALGQPLSTQPFTVRSASYHAAFPQRPPDKRATNPLYEAVREHRASVGALACDVACFDFAHEPPAVDGPWRGAVDGIIRVKVNIAWSFDDPSYRFAKRSLQWSEKRLTRIISDVRGRARGTVDGQSRTLAVELEVRHLLTTFPTASRGKWATMRDAYLTELRVHDEAAYATLVDKIQARDPAHVTVKVSKGLHHVALSPGGPQVGALVSIASAVELASVLPRVIGAALGHTTRQRLTHTDLTEAVRTVFDPDDLTLERLQ